MRAIGLILAIRERLIGLCDKNRARGVTGRCVLPRSDAEVVDNVRYEGGLEQTL